MTGWPQVGHRLAAPISWPGQLAAARPTQACGLPQPTSWPPWPTAVAPYRPQLLLHRTGPGPRPPDRAAGQAGHYIVTVCGHGPGPDRTHRSTGACGPMGQTAVAGRRRRRPLPIDPGPWGKTMTRMRAGIRVAAIVNQSDVRCRRSRISLRVQCERRLRRLGAGGRRRRDAAGVALPHSRPGPERARPPPPPPAATVGAASTHRIALSGHSCPPRARRHAHGRVSVAGPGRRRARSRAPARSSTAGEKARPAWDGGGARAHARVFGCGGRRERRGRVGRVRHVPVGSGQPPTTRLGSAAAGVWDRRHSAGGAAGPSLAGRRRVWSLRRISVFQKRGKRPAEMASGQDGRGRSPCGRRWGRG